MSKIENHSIFGSYSQNENRVTAALLQILKVGGTEFISDFIGSIEEVEFPSKEISITTQIGEENNIYDGLLECDFSFRIFIESKIGNNKVDENVKLTKAVGTLALENHEKVSVLGLQVDKNTQDIGTLAAAANYSLKASNIALQDHATLVQHDAQIAENSRRISSVERDVKAVGASAAALAALKPIEYHEGQKAQIMAAVGTYKGKTSTALGVAHYANPDLLIHAGAAYGGDHSVMANAGVTIGIGNAPTAPKASPATVKVLEDKVADLQAQNKEIRDLLDKVLAQQPQQAPQAAVKTTK